MSKSTSSIAARQAAKSEEKPPATSEELREVSTCPSCGSSRRRNMRAVHYQQPTPQRCIKAAYVNCADCDQVRIVRESIPRLVAGRFNPGYEDALRETVEKAKLHGHRRDAQKLLESIEELRQDG